MGFSNLTEKEIKLDVPNFGYRSIVELFPIFPATVEWMHIYISVSQPTCIFYSLLIFCTKKKNNSLNRMSVVGYNFKNIKEGQQRNRFVAFNILNLGSTLSLNTTVRLCFIWIFFLVDFS